MNSGYQEQYYLDWTNALIEQVRGWRIPDTFYNGVRYEAGEIVEIFRNAFLDKWLSFEFHGAFQNSLKPSLGWCVVASYAWKILFPAFGVDRTPEHEHTWNTYSPRSERVEKFDLTKCQFGSEDEAESYYKDGIRGKSKKFLKANYKIIESSAKYEEKAKRFLAAVLKGKDGKD